jgi:hypothetical protein
MLRQHAKRGRAVKIIGIDRGERLANDVLGHEDRLAGAPRLGAIRRKGKTRRQLAQFLKDIFNGQTLLEPRANGFAEGGLDLVADHEDEFSKPGAYGVEDGIINDGFAVRSDGVNLFEAAVTAAHAGSENEQGWFGHCYF